MVNLLSKNKHIAPLFMIVLLMMVVVTVGIVYTATKGASILDWIGILLVGGFISFFMGILLGSLIIDTVSNY